MEELMEKCYFVRVIEDYHEDDDGEIFSELTYVKIPGSVAAPSEEVKWLLQTLGRIYRAEVFLELYEIVEEGNLICAKMGGMQSDVLLIGTAAFNGYEIITQIITPSGAFSLLFMDNYRVLIGVLGPDVTAELGLEYDEFATESYLAEFYGDYPEIADDKLYYPSRLSGKGSKKPRLF